MRSFGRVFRCSKKITTNNGRPKRMNILECQRTQPAMCVSFCHQLGNFNYFPNKLQEWLFWCCNHWIYIYSTRITSPEKKQHEHMHILVHIFMYIHLFRFCFVEHLARTTFTPHVIGDLNGEICIITFLPMCLLWIEIKRA